jgi:hypothetical protein
MVRERYAKSQDENLHEEHAEKGLLGPDRGDGTHALNTLLVLTIGLKVRGAIVDSSSLCLWDASVLLFVRRPAILVGYNLWRVHFACKHSSKD